MNVISNFLYSSSIRKNLLQCSAVSVPVPVAQSTGGAERSKATPGTDCSAGVPQTPAPDAVQTGRGRLWHGELTRFVHI